MTCRYCNKDVESYQRGRILATFNRWGYEGTLRVCGCKGIDPLNTDPSAKRDWVVYNKYGQVCNISPYTDATMQKGAELSEDGVHRFKLHRIWDTSKGIILFIMINPSTASATEDDKTITLLLEITKRWGYGGFYVGNLYPYRSSKPASLKQIQIPDEIHATNRKGIEEMSSECSLVVFAWGTKGPDERQKEPEWLRQILQRDVHCLGISVKGVPKHPKQWGFSAIPTAPILFRNF